MDALSLRLLADVVLVAHAALALFLTLGLVAILVGGPSWRLGRWRLGGWAFVRNRAFRLAHLVGMAVVALESVLGLTCPLTDFEAALRTAAGAEAYREGFIAHWLGFFLFYDLDERVFAGVYLAALGLTVWAWGRWRVGMKTELN